MGSFVVVLRLIQYYAYMYTVVVIVDQEYHDNHRHDITQVSRGLPECRD